MIHTGRVREDLHANKFREAIQMVPLGSSGEGAGVLFYLSIYLHELIL